MLLLLCRPYICGQERNHVLMGLTPHLFPLSVEKHLKYKRRKLCSAFSHLPCWAERKGGGGVRISPPPPLHILLGGCRQKFKPFARVVQKSLQKRFFFSLEFNFFFVQQKYKNSQPPGALKRGRGRYTITAGGTRPKKKKNLTLLIGPPLIYNSPVD